MNTDFRIDVTLQTHRKFRRLKKAIGPRAMEHLIAFWTAVATSNPAGDLRWTDEDIELAADWNGEDGVLFKALLDIGWIDETEEGYRPHDWEVHQPWASGAEERREKARATGRKGGHASAKARKARHGTAQPPKRNPSKPEAPASEVLQDPRSKPEAPASEVLQDPRSKPEAPASEVLQDPRSKPEAPSPSPIPSPKQDKDIPPESLRLAGILADHIVERDPGHSRLANGRRDKSVQAWAEEIDKIQRIDGRPWSDIERIIVWSQEDPFWQKNVLSGSGLRKQFDKLQAASREPSPAIKQDKVAQTYAAQRFFRERLAAAEQETTARLYNEGLDRVAEDERLAAAKTVPAPTEPYSDFDPNADTPY